MARKSLESRMTKVMETLLPVGSMQRREYLLSGDLRALLDEHRTRTAAIISRYENQEPGGWYAAFVAGDPDAALPDMPPVLRRALHLSDPPSVTGDMSASEAALAWTRYAMEPDT